MAMLYITTVIGVMNLGCRLACPAIPHERFPQWRRPTPPALTCKPDKKSHYCNI